MTKNFEIITLNQVRGYASLATKLAKQYAPSRHLKKSIESVVDVDKGKYTIRVSAYGPDARAQEYGSGTHARRARVSKHQLGPRGKILITPQKGKKFLAFHWELANKNIPRLPDGRVLLKEVKHPGVKSANNEKGYIAPAINDVKAQIRKRFGREAAKGISLDIRASFKRAK